MAYMCKLQWIFCAIKIYQQIFFSNNVILFLRGEMNEKGKSNKTSVNFLSEKFWENQETKLL